MKVKMQDPCEFEGLSVNSSLGRRPWISCAFPPQVHAGAHFARSLAADERPWQAFEDSPGLPAPVSPLRIRPSSSG